MNTCFERQGYSILKSDLSPKQQSAIKDDLTIVPHVFGAPISADSKFYVYRESLTKLFVPYYYGVENFGLPLKLKLSNAIPLPSTVTFNGTLRDYQVPVIETVQTSMRSNANYPHRVLVELPCAWGKTAGAIHVICNIGLTTMVIVHMGFLMDQWIERIAQYAPNARVGRIQGSTVDIIDKDIVLCMLQSLVSKDYPTETFNMFGLVVIDEVHHISSNSFSQALFKIGPKYMLGLSATLGRKDGTLPVIKMFLGDIICKVKRETNSNVNVIPCTFRCNDDTYNETILDFRGKPQYSSMISKLCAYSPRSEFIIDKLKECLRFTPDTTHIMTPCSMCGCTNNYLMKTTCCNMVTHCINCLNRMVAPTLTQTATATITVKKVKVKAKCPHCNKVLAFTQNYIMNTSANICLKEERHIIVMAHNLNLLDYLYTKICCKNIASVGYYVGGMNEQDLKKSEEKQVILCTYAMAQEGLDIKSLNTEFLITPKTDVVQAIGRMLRETHSQYNPTAYDFVDTHDCFISQWKKRKTYYKSQNYKIITNAINATTTTANDEDDDEENNCGKCLIKKRI